MGHFEIEDASLHAKQGIALSINLTLYRAASDPTYLERGRADSSRTSVLGPRCPDRPNDESPPNFWCQCGLQKKELSRLAKNWARGPNLKILEIGQPGRKIDFQEFHLGRTKIDIAR